ncbi:MAG: hypothetical protein AAFN50_03745 [Pseudomonadota bacterium]
MHGRRNPFVAQEGLPLLVLVAAVIFLLIRYSDPLYAVLPGVAFVLLFLVFRDPRRKGPSVALGIVSPVDGEVVEVNHLEEGDLEQPAHRILIRVNSLGTYTARSPIEGHIKDPGSGRALWVQTDEGDDVLLKFTGHRFGLAPRSFARYGERLGQGQRCAYLRLTRFAEVQIPVDGKVNVEPGDTVVAGIDLLGSVPAPR